MDVLVRAAIVLAAVGMVCGGSSSAAPSAKGPPPCREAAILSVHGGKVLRKLSARGGDYAGYSHGPLLPGEDAVPDGHGGWYVAGFGLAHLHSDGSVDKAWSSSLRRSFRLGTLARFGNRLYGSDGRRVFAVEAPTGRVLWSSALVSGPTGQWIVTIAAGRNAVYVGGGFHRVGATTRIGLAALDPASGRLLPWQAPALLGPSQAAHPALSRLALSNTRLYFSGDFGRLGRRRARRPAGVAAVQASDGSLTSFSPRSRPGDIYAPEALAVHGRLVLLDAGEGFPGAGVSGVFDAKTGRRVPGYGFDQMTDAGTITVSGSIAYLGNGIGGFGGNISLLAINLRTAHFEKWFPMAGQSVSVSTIAVSGRRVFVGGSFCKGR